jgi:hypothetical protein
MSSCRAPGAKQALHPRTCRRAAASRRASRAITYCGPQKATAHPPPAWGSGTGWPWGPLLGQRQGIVARPPSGVHLIGPQGPPVAHFHGGFRILNDLAVFRLLGAINLASPFGPRDHAIIRLALYTGLRVSELTGLNVGHVFSDAPRELLDLPASLAKGHRSRQVPLSPQACRAVAQLVDFLRLRGMSSAPDSPLLQDRRHRRLPVREVQRMLQLARERANLDIKATPHTLRHCFASNCARQSSLHNVKELLGHQSIRSTEIYLHTRPEDLRAAVTF